MRESIADSKAALLTSLFAALDDSQTPYLVLNSYDDFPVVTSDIDLLVSERLLPKHFAALLETYQSSLGATVIQHIEHYHGHFYALVTWIDNQPIFLQLDLFHDLHYYGHVFYDYQTLMNSRSRHNDFWVMEAPRAFGYYLVKKMLKAEFGERHCKQLSLRFRSDPAGCEREISRFWSGADLAMIVQAADTGDWQPVKSNLTQLRTQLVHRRKPIERVRGWLSQAKRVLRRVRQRSGVHLVLIGVDGSGKSSVASGVVSALAETFRKTEVGHWAPGLFRRSKSDTAVPTPHAERPRSMLASLGKVAYWLADFSAGYFLTIYPKLLTSGLFVSDRYLLDARVDPKRYRSSAPDWMLRLLIRMTPRPDLVILLDAPVSVIEGRKQELPTTEVTRQRLAYLDVVGALSNGHIVDAAQPIENVVAEVGRVVTDYLAERTEERMALGSARSGNVRE